MEQSLPHQSHDINDPFKNESIFDRLKFFFQDLLIGKGDANYERKKLLINIRKRLKAQDKPLYNVKYDMATGHLADILFEIYRFTHPLDKILNIHQNVNLRADVEKHFVESKLSDEQKAILKDFNKEKLAETHRLGGEKLLSKYLSDKFKAFHKGFNKKDKDEINLWFARLLEISNLVRIDLFSVLKKFAPDIKEDVISEKPTFLDVDGRYVIDDLADLTETIHSIHLRGNFYHPVQILGELTQLNIISESDLNRFINYLSRLVKSDYLPQVIRYSSRDPYYRPLMEEKLTDIVSIYLKNLFQTAKSLRNEVVREHKKAELTRLSSDLFGDLQFKPLDNYNRNFEANFKDLKVDIYLHSDGLTYLKHFIMEIYNHYIRETINEIVVHGAFNDKDLLKGFSTHFHKCNEIMKHILEFDESLKSSSDTGEKLKVLMRKASSEVMSQQILQEYIQGINDRAAGILNDAIHDFYELSLVLAKIGKDYKSVSQNVISNVITL
ncbi:MAG: DUF5312 domain-containing protein, partial [Spirochaetota bacterium]|nr:DUF5312 domain-containing protein [Spirochaetota bacterium]